MLSELDIQYIDHFAVTTINLEETLEDYLSLPGAKLLRGPGSNPAQKVNYAFVQQQNGSVIEILSPQENSPIEKHTRDGGGAYHLCFAVFDLDESIQKAIDHGAKMVVEPKPDYAFDGRRVAFLIHSHHGLFELLEAWPATGTLRKQVAEIKKDISPAVSESSNKASLINVFKKHFDLASENEITALDMDTCEAWDSLKHVLLFMDIESTFKKNIPAIEMATLKSFNQILNRLG